MVKLCKLAMSLGVCIKEYFWWQYTSLEQRMCMQITPADRRWLRRNGASPQGSSFLYLPASAPQRSMALRPEPTQSVPVSLQVAFQQIWSGAIYHLFPPLPLLPCVLQKIIRDKTSCLLVTPWWPQQPWFPHLLQLYDCRRASMYAFLQNWIYYPSRRAPFCMAISISTT